MKWITNHLQIKGDKSIEVLLSLLTKTTEYIQDEPEEWRGFDFNKIRPLPDALKEDFIPNVVKENWCLANWGVRENAFDTQIPDENKAEVFFDTANGTVEGLIRELSAVHPDCTFEYEYADTEAGSFAGKYKFVNSQIILQEQYPAGSKEGYEMYFNLWGDKRKFTFNEQKNTYERAEMEME